MKRPIRVVDTYGVNVTYFGKDEKLFNTDGIEQFDVVSYYDQNTCMYVLEIPPRYVYLYRSKSSLLNAKKRRIINWIELENKNNFGVLFHSSSAKLISTTYIYINYNKE